MYPFCLRSVKFTVPIVDVTGAYDDRKLRSFRATVGLNTDISAQRFWPRIFCLTYRLLTVCIFFSLTKNIVIITITLLMSHQLSKPFEIWVKKLRNLSKSPENY